MELKAIKGWFAEKNNIVLERNQDLARYEAHVLMILKETEKALNAAGRVALISLKQFGFQKVALKPLRFPLAKTNKRLSIA